MRGQRSTLKTTEKQELGRKAFSLSRECYTTLSLWRLGGVRCGFAFHRARVLQLAWEMSTMEVNVNTHQRAPDRTRRVPEGGAKFSGFSWSSHEPAKLDVNAGVISSAPQSCPRGWELFQRTPVIQTLRFLEMPWHLHPPLGFLQTHVPEDKRGHGSHCGWEAAHPGATAAHKDC